MENEYDAFDAGVEPGGLRTRSNVRLLICYILDSLKKPIKRDYVITSMQKNGIANYFEIIDAFVDLRNKENIELVDEAEDLYTVTKTGRLIAANLGEDLPKTIRERALSAVSELLMQEQNRNENTVEIVKSKHGYMVDCHIKGGDEDLFSFQIYVPDSKQARLVKRNFLSDPEMIYKMMIASITGNAEFAQQTLAEISERGIKLK